MILARANTSTSALYKKAKLEAAVDVNISVSKYMKKLDTWASRPALSRKVNSWSNGHVYTVGQQYNTYKVNPQLSKHHSSYT